MTMIFVYMDLKSPYKDFFFPPLEVFNQPPIENLGFIMSW